MEVACEDEGSRQHRSVLILWNNLLGEPRVYASPALNARCGSLETDWSGLDWRKGGGGGRCGTQIQSGTSHVLCSINFPYCMCECKQTNHSDSDRLFLRLSILFTHVKSHWSEEGP